MPRSRAPQVRQGPSSKEAAECEPLATANTESIFSTFGLWHFPQSTRAEKELTIFSKRAPQFWHLYSKIGMDVSPLAIYRMLADNSTVARAHFSRVASMRQ
jgi:hypothetical protein